MASGLYDAAVSGNVPLMLKLMTDYRADPFGTSPYGLTPVYGAACSGHSEALECLLKLGADLTKADVSHRTPLHRAAVDGHSSAVGLLLSHGADVDAISITGASSLFEATTCEDAEASAATMAVLLDNGADVSRPNSRGYAAIHVVSRAGEPELITQLIMEGANPNTTDTQGNTPLIWATSAGRPDLAKVLLALGASVSLENHHKGEAPLQVAIASGNTEVCVLLLNEGASLQDEGLQSAVLHPEILGLLVDLGADLDSSDSGGYTALKCAQGYYERSMNLLLCEGAARCNEDGMDA